MVIPFEAFTGSDAARVMGRIVGWLGWLGDSTLTTDRDIAAPGDRLTFTLAARHNGSASIHTTMTATLPISMTLDPASLTPGASFDPVSGRVTWTGTLDPGAAITASYQVTLDVGLLPGALLTTTAVFRDDTHGIPFDQVSVVRVAAPDFSLSAFTAPAKALSGKPLTYTLIVSNSGASLADSARITVLLPLSTRPMTGSLSLSGPGAIAAAGSAINWQGALNVGEAFTLTYQTVAPRVMIGTPLLSEALLWDEVGGMWELALWTDVSPHQVYLPIIFKR
jgi:uncharacterized repeat protein (TIGR01451 family)